MKKKLSLVLIGLLAAMTVLSGCGSKKPVSEETPQKETVESTTEKETSNDVANDAAKEDKPAADESAQEKSENGGDDETKAGTEEKSPVFSNTVKVGNAKEFLAAIAPDTQIVLAPGKYNLSEALEETGFSEYESYLQPCYGYGSGVAVCDVDNLMIVGPTEAVAEIVVNDPDVATLSFMGCEDIIIANVTAGHDVEKGTCAGSVINLDHCLNVTLEGDDLYGCGTYGVEAYNCSGVKANGCIIRECTYGIISTYQCSDTSFNNCIFKECEDLDLIYAEDSNLVFYKCDFAKNRTDYDFVKRDTNSVVIFKGCSFGKEETDRINELNEFAGVCYFDSACRFDGNFIASYVTVSSAKELFEAIRPGATICVEPGRYNLTECANDIIANRRYAWTSTHRYISLEEEYDGVEVILRGIDDLTIIGLGNTPNDVEFVVDPRYAAVFKLDECHDISFVNLTAGHTERGTCVGDVIDIEGGEGFVFANVDLYGCGVNGIGGYMGFSEIRVYDSVIHDCSDSPLCLYNGYGRVEVLGTSMYGSGAPGGYGEGEYEVYFQKCDFGVYETMGLNPMDEEAEKKISMFACTFADTSGYEDYAYEW